MKLTQFVSADAAIDTGWCSGIHPREINLVKPINNKTHL